LVAPIHGVSRLCRHQLLQKSFGIFFFFFLKAVLGNQTTPLFSRRKNF